MNNVFILFKKNVEYLILVFFICVYLCFAIKDITLPGINFDEGTVASEAINLLKNKNTHYVFITDSIFLGRRLPLMMSYYDPILGSYLLLPFFSLFGISVFSLRGSVIFFALLALILAYILTKKMFNRKAAFIAILLLVTSPDFILSTRILNFFFSYTFFFSMAALFCFMRWRESNQARYFFLGAFLLGMGLSASLWFITPLIAIPVAALIAFGRKELAGKTRRIFIYFLGLIFFLLGSFSLFYANFINKSTFFMTGEYIFKHFRDTGSNMSNLDYLTNITQRFKHLLYLLEQRGLVNEVFILGEGNVFFKYVFFFSLFWLIVSLFFRKNLYFKKTKILFIILVAGIIFMLSPFTLSSFHISYLTMLTPYLQIIIALGLIEFSWCFKERILKKISIALVCFTILALAGANMKAMKGYYADMRRVGGHSLWSDAIYELADWIKKVKPSNVVALTFGFSRNLYFLLGGEVYIQDIHSSSGFNFEEGEQNFKDIVTTHFLKDEKTRYLVNVQWCDQRAYELFKKIVNSAGKRLVEDKLFYQRDGKPVFMVYSVK